MKSIIKSSLFTTLTILPLSLPAEDYQSVYNSGIEALYQKKHPEEAVEIFERAHEMNPDRWEPLFMIGYALRQYLQKPSEALPYFEKGIGLVTGINPWPHAELGVCYMQLGRDAEAIRYLTTAEEHYREKREEVPVWLYENLAWLYYRKGETRHAFATAPVKSWLKKYLAPKTITVRWDIHFREALERWNLADQERIRISIPLDRPYQKLKSMKIADISDGSVRAVSVRIASDDGNRYIEMDRGEEGYPEEIRLEFAIGQSMDSVLKSRPTGASPVRNPSDEHALYANESANGYYSNDDPKMIELIERISADGGTDGEKVEMIMNHLRANFKYGDRIEESNVYEIFKSGQGDCGYFSAVAIGFVRSLKIPVRFVYGLNAGYAPPTPHAIIEIYDRKAHQWYPHDPQSAELYGIINPTYIPFTAYTPDGGWRRGPDGIYEIDTTQFYWSGSGHERMSVNIIDHGIPATAERSLTPVKPPEGLAVPQSVGKPAFLPNPVK